MDDVPENVRNSSQPETAQRIGDSALEEDSLLEAEKEVRAHGWVREEVVIRGQVTRMRRRSMMDSAGGQPSWCSAAPSGRREGGKRPVGGQNCMVGSGLNAECRMQTARRTKEKKEERGFTHETAK